MKSMLCFLTHFYTEPQQPKYVFGWFGTSAEDFLNAYPNEEKYDQICQPVHYTRRKVNTFNCPQYIVI